jgi:hypothetical protein
MKSGLDGAVDSARHEHPCLEDEAQGRNSLVVEGVSIVDPFSLDNEGLIAAALG